MLTSRTRTLAILGSLLSAGSLSFIGGISFVRLELVSITINFGSQATTQVVSLPTPQSAPDARPIGLEALDRPFKPKPKGYDLGGGGFSASLDLGGGGYAPGYDLGGGSDFR